MENNQIPKTRLVNLFELDSVRQTDAEILLGQKALYREIAERGNTVVLTYNQFVDSRGFFSLFDNEIYFESIISLFKMGRIKFSQYKDIRSLGQYMLDAVDENKKFWFSALPIKHTQRNLTALIRRSLIYTDLSELYAYLVGGSRTDMELIYLFAEYIERSDEDNDSEGTVVLPSSSVEHLRNILQNLGWLLTMIMRISPMPGIYIPQKKYAEGEKRLTLCDFIRFYLEMPVPDEYTDNMAWHNAQGIICNLKAYSCELETRSDYIREIKSIHDNVEEAFKKDEMPEEYLEFNRESCELCEAIINLCYLYVCEYSVCNSSKRYDINELTSDGERTSFYADFMNQLDIQLNGISREGRFLKNEGVEFREFRMEEHKNEFPKFDRCVRIVKHTMPKEKKPKGEDKELAKRKAIDPVAAFSEIGDVVPCQGENLIKQQRRHKTRAGLNILRHIVPLILSLGLIFVLELLMNQVEGMLDGVAFLSSPIFGALKIVAFLIIVEIITSVLSKWTPLSMSISEVINSGFELIRDLISIAIPINLKTNVDQIMDYDLESTEPKHDSLLIDFVVPTRIGLYKKFKGKISEDGRQDLFKEDIPKLKLADMTNPQIQRELMGIEQMHNVRFGVVYQSKYNTLVVDAIESSNPDKKYIPYERIIPTAGNGAVIITIQNGNFVMLKQWRHAIRKCQLCFVRGFAEEGETPIKTAIREVGEELKNPIIKGEPEYIGSISADSGLTAGCASVWVCEIDSYECIKGEGIEDVVVLPYDRLIAEIQGLDSDGNMGESRVDDGFTLAALMLYQSRYKK